MGMIGRRHIFFVLSQTIEKMNFSVRVINNCRGLEINTMFELLEKMKNKDPDFVRIFGPKSKIEIKKEFLKNGIDIEDVILDKNFKKHFYLQQTICSHRIIKN
jgi:DNA-directed RNA polymerase alpha subunit